MCSPNTPAATFDSRLVRFELLEIEATLEEEKKQKAIQRSEFIHTRDTYFDVLRNTVLALLIAAEATHGQAAFTLRKTYDSSNFLDSFNFRDRAYFDSIDPGYKGNPTGGSINYLISGLLTSLITLIRIQGADPRNNCNIGGSDTRYCTDGNNYSGCGNTMPSGSYSKTFNANKGGIYATWLTTEAIKVSWFPRNNIPADIKNGKPKPNT
ncbi:unnamed protein product [Fusarium graminearum]|nr:unnamed protein product [Fusarium graminearum]